MPNTNLPNGLAASGVPTMGISGVPAGTGSYWFVSSGTNGGIVGNDGYPGTAQQPFATLNRALSFAVAGDIIVLGMGHAETISAAGGITVSTAGLQIFGEGEGATRPTFTFSATASTFLITGASTTLRNVIGVPSIDSVVAPFSVGAANVTLDIEWRDASSTVEAVRAILGDTNANNMNVNLVYKGDAGGNAVVNAIRLVGTDNGRINVDFYGVASTSVVQFITTACTNVEVTGTFYNVGTTNLSKNVVDTTGTSTWGVQGWDASAGSAFSGSSTTPIAGDDISTVIANQAVPSADSTANALERDVVGNKTDAAVTVVAANKSLMAYLKGAINWLTVGVADATSNASAADVIGNKTDAVLTAIAATKSILAYAKTSLQNVGFLLDAAVYNSGTTSSLMAYQKGQTDLMERVAISSTAILANGTTIFTIAGGPIQVQGLISQCVVGGDAAASTVQYSATASGLSGVTFSNASGSVANAAAGATVVLIGTALSTAAVYNANGNNLGMTSQGGITLVPGVVTTVIGGADSTTGTWRHILRYKPLVPGVTVS